MDTELEDRFPNRYAGSAFAPFILNVKDTGGEARNLTSATATWTLRRVGSVPVLENEGHTNTPSALGIFEFTVTAAQISKPGEYTATIKILYLGETEPDVTVMGVTITPAK